MSAVPTLAVLAVGAVAPVGGSALEVAMGARAAKLTPRPTRVYLQPSVNEAVDGAFAPAAPTPAGVCVAGDLDDALHGFDRLIALATPALREAAASIHEPLPCVLVIAEPGRPDDDPCLGPELLAALAAASGVSLDHERSSVLRAGHGGLAAALDRAAALLGERVTRVLVGGVDSYLHPGVLRWLDERGALHGPGVRGGFLPAEGAAFALLGGPAERERSLARVRGWVHASGEGAPAMADLLTRLCPDGAAWILHDVNGEPWRIDAWTEAEAAAHLGGARVRSRLPEALGDVGAATGAMAIAIASSWWAAGCAPAGAALVALCSRTGERGAFLLESEPSMGSLSKRAPRAFRASVGAPTLHRVAGGRAGRERRLVAIGAPAPATAARRLARACMEDIAILSTLRRVPDGLPWTADLARFEQRLLNNLDALAALWRDDALGAGAVEDVERYARSSPVPDAGRAFARALIFGSLEGASMAGRAAEGLAAAAPSVRPAVAEALALAPSPLIAPALESVVRSARGDVAALGLAVLRERREVPLRLAIARLDDDDGSVRRAAALALGAAGRGARRALERRLGEETDDGALAAVSRSLIALGAASGLELARGRLRGALASGASSAGAWLPLVAIAGAADDADLLEGALSDPAGPAALGWHGHVDHVDPLIDALAAAEAQAGSRSDEGEARRLELARALLRITGAELDAPEGEIAPSAAAWREHWDAQRHRFDRRRRYRLGAPYTPHALLAELACDGVPPSLREEAELELARLFGAPTAFRAGDWIARQLAALASLQASAPISDPGSWLRPVHASTTVVDVDVDADADRRRT